MRKPRVAIFGGDERNETLFEWPEHVDLRFFPEKSPRSLARLNDSISSGSIDHLVVLTRFVGHGHLSGVKEVPTVHWNFSPGKLSREIGRMFPPPPPPPNPLLQASRVDSPSYGGGRGPIVPKEVRMSEPTESPKVPMFEHVVSDPPKKDESFGQALARIIKAEDLSQTELAKMIGKDTSTVNGWIKDRGRPADFGPLVDLWPELARFDGGKRRHKEAPTAKEAERLTALAVETKEMIKEVKAVPTVAQPIAHPAPLPRTSQVSPEIAVTLARWKRAKEDLASIEAHLLFLLREAGL